MGWGKKKEGEFTVHSRSLKGEMMKTSRDWSKI